ncbi:MAG: bifunctional phosphoribosyl-AMP cyclohydrolase/phosphoribosyl-ATP diphosphatase HisIE [Gammaproteobacteria bacterium]|nr:bifunctional phosphoribosyl-AMP cyclohydrolase/phosphoribosyl-ATP diphosphatase HisIE [Gammaproteobacteria bacterium]
MKNFADQVDWKKCNGMVPAVVCHSVNGKVLMVAWCNRQALDKTLATRQVTFFSRSRNELWTKGATSGNTLKLTSIHSDCDNDTLLIEALPAGPVCHTGKDSCFDSLVPMTGFGFLGELEALIEKRKARANVTESYTARLFAKGVAKIAQKVGEEGVEVAIAGVQDDATALTNESADLLYHLLVLLAEREIPLDKVVAALRERHQVHKETG